MLGSAAATLGVVAALVLVWALWSYQGPGPATDGGETRVVMLRKGAGLTEIASTLERSGAIRSKALFAAAAQFTGAAKALKAGEEVWIAVDTGVAGPVFYALTVDCANAVNESNENNNKAALDRTIK